MQIDIPLWQSCFKMVGDFLHLHIILRQQTSFSFTYTFSTLYHPIMASRRFFTAGFSNAANFCQSKQGLSASSRKWARCMQQLLKNNSTKRWSSSNRMLAALSQEKCSSYLAKVNFEPSIAISNAFRSPPLVISVGAAEVDALEPSGELDETDTFCNDEEALTGTIMSIFNVTRYTLESWSRLLEGRYNAFRYC